MTKKPANTRGVKTQVLEEKDKTVLYGSMTSSMQNGRACEDTVFRWCKRS